MMKKSKFMKALLVFGMSMVTATAIVGFTACDDDEHTHVDKDNNGKCDICDTPMTPETPLKVAVEKVELDKDELTLDIGDEETLVATVTPDNADDKDVVWSVVPEGVVTVVNGKVTAEAAGEATITATAGGKSATCLVTVNTPEPKPVVTEEEWVAALSESAFTNFTATVKMSDAEEGETGDIIKVDLANDKFSDGDVYYSKEDGNYYKYTKNEDSGKYVKEEITQEDYDGELSGLYPMYAPHFKDCFGDVDYNSETESYVGEDIDIGDGNKYGIDIKFDNGKLIYADIDYGEEAHILMQYSKYGTTTIELPTVGGDTEEDNATVTAEQWTQILENATSFSIDLAEGDTHTYVQIDGDKRLQQVNQIKELYVKDGESYYLYYYDATSWAKEEIEAENYATVDKYANIISGLKGDYESFNYSDGVYTAESLNKSDTLGTINNVEITFDNGALKSIKFVQIGVTDSTYEITNVGSTTIELPTVSVTPDPGDETGIALTFSEYSRYGGASGYGNVEMKVQWDIDEAPLDKGSDKHFDKVYINGEEHTNANWTNQGMPEGAANQAHLWLLDFTAEYDTKYVVTLKKGDTVVATGTILIETPKSMAVSSESDKLIGTTLTLDPEDVVLLEASITGNFPAGASYKWEITEGAEYIELESDADTAMITAKEYSGESNLTAKVKVTYGVEDTTVTKVISVTVKGTNGDDPGTSLPETKLTFTAPLKDYYGGTGDANYHDYISLTDIVDKFEYSADNIKVSATLNGEEIAITYLRGELGGDKNMHFHVKIGGSSTTLDSIKSGLVITMIFIGTDGQDCAYAIIEN